MKKEVPELQSTKHEENNPHKIEQGDINKIGSHKVFRMVNGVDMANSRQ